MYSPVNMKKIPRLLQISHAKQVNAEVGTNKSDEMQLKTSQFRPSTRAILKISLSF